MDGKSTGVPLADFVAALREEIKDARREADPEVPIELGPVTVEMTVLTRREGEGRAGLRFWVVEAAATGKLATESTQRLTMELIPRGPGGSGPARVRDRDD
ncbi:MAG TPA: trypco2 family protein [Mycobacteriales bacterium]